ncbi:MAG: hypothetical protein K9N62_00090 [Verrucomicrobia bacterium]|jgi:stage IV sporulation protein FB|nr:hypothetical protein [Verrucomicrobiota bacterium]
MIRFSLFRIPIVVEGWFWLTCAFLGGAMSASRPEDWIRVLVWTAVVLGSIIVHELGHALVGRHFGADPAIRLHGLGGATFLPEGRFSRKENILVTAAGPAAGLLLGVLIYALVRVGLSDSPNPLLGLAARYGLYINFVWSLLNLLPILPLDGGQILRDVLGPRRKNLVCNIGFVLAAVLCVWAALEGYVFGAVMLAMLAYQNFRKEASIPGLG